LFSTWYSYRKLKPLIDQHTPATPHSTMSNALLSTTVDQNHYTQFQTAIDSAIQQMNSDFARSINLACAQITCTDWKNYSQYFFSQDEKNKAKAISYTLSRINIDTLSEQVRITINNSAEDIIACYEKILDSIQNAKPDADYRKYRLNDTNKIQFQGTFAKELSAHFARASVIAVRIENMRTALNQVMNVYSGEKLLNSIQEKRDASLLRSLRPVFTVLSAHPMISRGIQELSDGLVDSMAHRSTKKAQKAMDPIIKDFFIELEKLDKILKESIALSINEHESRATRVCRDAPINVVHVEKLDLKSLKKLRKSLAPSWGTSLFKPPSLKKVIESRVRNRTRQRNQSLTS